MEENLDIFWLYVGQSICLQQRIRYHHHERRHQSIHFGLHYHIWNTLSEKSSLFVILSTGKESDHPNRQLLLNIAEMWMCCIFQTLNSVHLDKYLPENIQKPWAGRHLNVALPLWQSFSNSLEDKTEAMGGRAAFTSFLQSPNPETRGWAENLREGFNQLRNSPDCEIRNYYQRHIFRSLQLATDARLRNAKKNLEKYLSGKEIPVHVTTTNRNTPYEGPLYDIRCGMFAFTISQESDLNLKDKDKVFVQFHLTDSKHPMMYSAHARTTDPASRFAISVSSCDSRGNDFLVWLINTRGIKVVCKMNSLVDILKGYSLEERRTFLRRWFPMSNRVNGKWVSASEYT